MLWFQKQQLLGAKTVEIDKLIRSFGFTRAAEVAYKAMDDYALKALRAYSAGINEYVRNSLALPSEFWLLNAEFEEWQPIHSVLVGVFIGFQLSPQWAVTILRSSITNIHGAEFANKLLFFDDKYNMFEGRYTIIKEDQAKLQANSTKTEKVLETNPRRKLVSIIPTFDGMSNAIAIHGNHTMSGKPLLSGDTHLPATQPAALYMVSLKLSRNQIRGFSIPGMPVIISGRSDYVAWAPTLSYIENIDIYNLKVDRDRERYFHDGKWKDMKVHKTKIKVKDGKTVGYTTYETHHGAVILPLEIRPSDMQKNKKKQKYRLSLYWLPEGPIAISWAGYWENRSVVGMLGLMNAKSLHEFLNYTAMLDGSAMTLTFATTDGHIGFTMAGKVPKRNHIEESTFIRNGTRKEEDWFGFVPEAEMPRSIDPKEGFIVSCNNKISPPKTKGGIGTTWVLTIRTIRAHEIIKSYINSGRRLNEDDVMRMQVDTIDLFAREVVPRLISVVDSRMRNLKQQEKDIVKRLLEILRDWDYSVDRESTAALVYSVWIMELKKTLMEKYFPEPLQKMIITKMYHFEHHLGNLIKAWSIGNKTNSKYCENKENEGIENKCIHNVVISLLNTYDKISAELGDNQVWVMQHTQKQNNWKWGSFNSLKNMHFPFSVTPLKALYETEFRGSVKRTAKKNRGT
eukprot:TRINITY_DN6025_c0_g1_i1.p1 TRINITY_DN6025_c0_g1~~TRINITY_DN6025_c0_g1_i1.p1  ORF type:complete len:682 (+),score=42.11 TRINITY_DN6025_c0_g1_i1:374-2419(+)